MSTNKQIIQSSLAGGIASLIIDFFTYPLDTQKTIIQATSKRINFLERTKNQSKFQGISTVFTCSFVSGFIFFYSYESFQDIFSKHLKIKLGIAQVMAAALSEAIANLYRVPFETIKQQMQVGWNSKFRQSIRSIFKSSNGIKGFYKGYFPIIFREIPFSMIEYPVYSCLKKIYVKKKQQKQKYLQVKIPFYISAMNGFLAAALASFATNPIDVIKTRIMTQRDGYYKSILDTFIKIMVKEDKYALMKGVQIRTLNLGFSGSIFFYIYELSLKYVVHAKIFKQY